MYPATIRGTNPRPPVSSRQTFHRQNQKVAAAPGGASHELVSRNFNWIWYLGAAVWFLNAALAMHHGNLRLGLTNAAISAGFLAAGIFFRRMAKRQARRNSGR